MHENPFADLDVEDILSSAEAACAAAEQANRDVLWAAVHFADLYSDPVSDPDDQPADEADRARRRGAERSVRVGGAGTPLVREFAVAELATCLELSPWSARKLLGEALDLRHRLPRLWQEMHGGTVKVWVARRVAAMTRPISATAAGEVDAKVAAYAGTVSFGRLVDVVDAAILAAAPDYVAALRRRAAADQFVKTGPGNEQGIKSIYIRTLGPRAIWFEARVAQIAEALRVVSGSTESLDVRRAMAIGIIANPAQTLQLLADHANATKRPEPDDDSAGDGPSRSEEEEPLPDDEATKQPCPACAGTGLVGDPTAFIRSDLLDLDRRRLLPPVTLYLHLAQQSFTRDAEGVARFEGQGPVSIDEARAFFGTHCQVRITPVIDLAKMAPVDAYEIPHRLREAVHLRSPADIFPYATSTTRTGDIDHTDEYVPPDDGGPPRQTGLDNLGPMVRFHHRVKTHGGWELRQPFSGIFVWRSPHGRHYLVDHTGTRKTSQTA